MNVVFTYFPNTQTLIENRLLPMEQEYKQHTINAKVFIAIKSLITANQINEKQEEILMKPMIFV